MSNRDIERRLADRHFEDLRQAIAAHSDAWLVEALRDIPQRKRLEVEKDAFVMIGILAHRAAKRIEELTAGVTPETCACTPGDAFACRRATPGNGCICDCHERTADQPRDANGSPAVETKVACIQCGGKRYFCDVPCSACNAMGESTVLNR